MTTFILVAGAWHGSWCWERIVPALERQGYGVLTPDLPGLGNDSTDGATVTLECWAHFVADLVGAQPGQAILVGHSRAGAVISQAAEYVADPRAALVYLSGMLLPDGTSVMGFGADGGMSAELAASIVTNEADRSLTVRPETLGEVFYNTTAAEWVSRAAGRLRPEPIEPNVAALHLSDAGFGRSPRFYVECLQDAVLPPAIQRRMYTQLPCRRVISLDTDHSPFYSAPQELGDSLLSIAAELSHS